MFRQKACKKESDWAVTAFPEGNSKDGIIPLQAANNIHTERMKGAVNPGTRRCKLKRRAIQVDKHAPATNNDKEAFLILGRGVGQVMFQNNALSGSLMLAGILLNSWQMALMAIAGNVVSTLTACLSGYSREDIRNGLYGFNGTLVGIAIGVFMPVSVASLSLLVAGACLSTWIARLFSLQRRVPGFTAPNTA